MTKKSQKSTASKQINLSEKSKNIRKEKKSNFVFNLYDIHLTGAREDAFRSPMQLYGRLSALASDLSGHGIDFKPTDQQRDVQAIFNKRLKVVEEKFQKFITIRYFAI